MKIMYFKFTTVLLPKGKEDKNDLVYPCRSSTVYNWSCRRHAGCLIANLALRIFKNPLEFILCFCQFEFNSQLFRKTIGFIFTIIHGKPHKCSLTTEN